MIDSDCYAKLTETIELHLKTVGPKQWALVRDQFPEVSQATFWRKVKWVRDQCAEQCQVDNLQRCSDTSKATDQGHKEGADVFGYFKHLWQTNRLDELLDDAKTLKRQSMDKQGRITNPAAFAKSIVIRERILNSELDMLNRFWDLEHTEKFFNTILNTIEGVSPEVRIKVLNALSELNLREGRRAP
jgi:hypothetical protein